MILPVRRGGRRAAPGSAGKGFGRYAAAFQELPDLRHVVLGQAVMVAVKRDFLASEGHLDPVAALRVQLRAKGGQGMLRVLEVDIGADGMDEEGVHDFTVVMIHLNLKLMLPFYTQPSISRAVKTSMTHINTKDFVAPA
jgi:hypothetical protein